MKDPPQHEIVGTSDPRTREHTARDILPTMREPQQFPKRDRPIPTLPLKTTTPPPSYGTAGANLYNHDAVEFAMAYSNPLAAARGVFPASAGS